MTLQLTAVLRDKVLTIFLQQSSESPTACSVSLSNWNVQNYWRGWHHCHTVSIKCMACSFVRCYFLARDLLSAYTRLKIWTIFLSPLNLVVSYTLQLYSLAQLSSQERQDTILLCDYSLWSVLRCFSSAQQPREARNEYLDSKLDVGVCFQNARGSCLRLTHGGAVNR